MSDINIHHEGHEEHEDSFTVTLIFATEPMCCFCIGNLLICVTGSELYMAT